MINGLPNRPLYFYQKDIIGSGQQIEQCDRSISSPVGPSGRWGIASCRGFRDWVNHRGTRTTCHFIIKVGMVDA